MNLLRSNYFEPLRIAMDAAPRDYYEHAHGPDPLDPESLSLDAEDDPEFLKGIIRRLITEMIALQEENGSQSEGAADHRRASAKNRRAAHAMDAAIADATSFLDRFPLAARIGSAL